MGESKIKDQEDKHWKASNDKKVLLVVANFYMKSALTCFDHKYD